MTAWSVPPDLCGDRAAAVLCCGPSAVDADIDPDRFVIAVGRSLELLERADLLLAADPRTWTAYPHLLDFDGPKVALVRADRPVAHAVVEWLANRGVLLLGHAGNDGLSTDPGMLCGFSAAHQAVNLAVLGGARRVELHGADFRRGLRGETHWHEPHPYSQKLDFAMQCRSIATLVDPLAVLGVEVVNMTPDSALECFPCC